MARRPKPWFDEYRGAWYVNIRGKRHRLDTEKMAAERRFHELMAKPEEILTKPSDDLAVVLIDRFLTWCEKNRPDSYGWYFKFLNPFCHLIKALKVDQVEAHHVEEFIDKDTWGPSGRRAAITAIKRAFNWAVKQGLIAKNPVKGVEKPEATVREQIISREQHEAILQRVSKPFGELLELAWETGARPFELYRLETRHLELENCRAVFPRIESKGKKRQRVLYFSDEAMKIVKRNMQPHGPVMRNDDGKAWTVYSINCAFTRLQAVMGREVSTGAEISDQLIGSKMKQISASRQKRNKPPLKPGDIKRQARKSLADSAARKNAPKFCLYGYRHSFAHRKLSEGNDSMIVATWLGHRDTQMLARVYAHIHKNQDLLLAQLNGKPTPGKRKSTRAAK